MSNLFDSNSKQRNAKTRYTAKDIQVLEGLEPVRKRPGMYIGGTDETAMQHLVVEVLDNSMDEVVAGFATNIYIEIHEDNSVTIGDNGRGIPVDNHPKFSKKSALEVILTTLHSGGKFSQDIYQTSGGLHGVGISVVNALSDRFEVTVIRDGKIFYQDYSKGKPLTPLKSSIKPKENHCSSGTTITFHPDPEIFGKKAEFNVNKLYELVKSKAYLYKGVYIDWKCEKTLIRDDKVPESDSIHFPGGLLDYLKSNISLENLVVDKIFSDSISSDRDNLKIEWAISWSDEDSEKFIYSFCNTIATPLGGTHEQGFKQGILRSIKNYGEMIGNKKATNITVDDILTVSSIILSIFINEPLFQGQTKEKLVSPWVSKTVENIIKDHLDNWLLSNKDTASQLLEYFIEISEIRINKKNEKKLSRKNITQKLRLPGKLADCRKSASEGTELFIVEGDSAGGSAKQARDREMQAILPIRGKLLNVASSSLEKISQNQEIKDLETALILKPSQEINNSNLRYDKVIIMTDADVDGAHIASLLMTFFYLRMPKLIEGGHLYLACPPLYRIVQSNKTFYAIDDKQKEIILKKLNPKTKITIGRFKGLGEMTPSQLKETTMDPKNRLLLKVNIKNLTEINKLVNNLMGKKAESRFEFIQSEALSKIDNIINNLDI